jgi:hypothetical protein
LKGFATTAPTGSFGWFDTPAMVAKQAVSLAMKYQSGIAITAAFGFSTILANTAWGIATAIEK